MLLKSNKIQASAYVISVAAIFILAATYRFTGLNRESLWSDELWGVMACSKGSIAAMIQNLVFHDNHPPGYQAILYFSMLWFGKSDFVIRAPSALAGVLTVITVFFMGRRLFSRRTACIAALFVAGSYQAIYYSQEARAYSLLALFCLLHSYFFIELFIRARVNDLNTILFAVTGALCAYLHYAGVVFIASEVLFLSGIIFFLKEKKESLQAVLFAFVIIFILYLKWIPVMYQHMTGIRVYWAEKPTLMTLYETLRLLLGPNVWISSFSIMAIVATILLFLSHLLKYRPAKNIDMLKISMTLIVLALLPMVVFYVKSLVSQSVYTHRHFTFIIPLLGLVVARMIDEVICFLKTVRTQFVATVLVCLFIAIVQFKLNRDLYAVNAKEDYRGAVQQVFEDKSFLASLQSGKGVVIVSHDFFYHYFDLLHVNVGASNSLSQSRNQVRDIETLLLGKPETVYFLENASSATKDVRDVLESRYEVAQITSLTGINVIKYSVARVTASHQ